MPTEWNDKLAIALRDAVEPSLDLLGTSSLRKTLLGDDIETTLPAADPRLAWAVSSADRVPQNMLAPAGASIDWAASGEVTHPLSSARTTLGAVDLDALRTALAAIADDIATKNPGDTRKRWLHLWRTMPSRLAEQVPTASRAVSFIPADPRMPNLPVWARLAFDGALATAAPAPTFLVVQVGPSPLDASRPRTQAALASALALHTHLVWQALLVVVQELGPDAVLSPSLLGHPLCDRWLADQGILGSQIDAQSAAFGSLPGEFVALVPQARAAELGNACLAAVRTAWDAIAAEALDKLGAGKDDGFKAAWARQTTLAWEPSWVAVPWIDDCTGAGGLLSKQEVAAHEKWAKTHQDASGLEDPWAGIYFGLWHAAALAASQARRAGAKAVRAIEPGPRCKVCGVRQAMHDNLCAVCGVSAAWNPEVKARAEAASFTGQVACVLFSGDQLSALRRGGKEVKQGATMGDLMHTGISDGTARLRGAAKELTESIALLGPSRLACFEHAAQAFVRLSIPKLVADAGGVVLEAVADEQIVLVPLDKVMPLVKAVRERYREAFVEIDGQLVAHPGPSATMSAVVAVAESAAPAGQLVRSCRNAMSTVARDSLGGDAAVVVMSRRDGDDRALGLRGSELDAALGTLIAAFPSASSWIGVLRALRSVEPALASAEVDKPSPDGRATLIRDALVRGGIRGGNGEAPSDDEVARAMCSVIDCGLARGDGDIFRALDGLRVVACLAGGDR